MHRALENAVMVQFSHGKVLCVINLSAAVKSSLVVFILMIINA